MNPGHGHQKALDLAFELHRSLKDAKRDACSLDKKVATSERWRVLRELDELVTHLNGASAKLDAICRELAYLCEIERRENVAR